MNTSRVVRNAFVAAVQALVTGATLFFLYRYLLIKLGAADLGVWALVLATTSAASLANLGIASSTTKFVSQYLARNQPETASSIIQSAAISVVVILSIILPLTYPLLDDALGFFIQETEEFEDAMLILPYALFSFWLNSVAGVFQACIDGFQRVDLRGYLLMGMSVLYLLLVFWLVPIAGLEGLAQAQVIQAALLLLISWYILKRLMPALPLIPLHWKYRTFREILGYSLNFQVIAMTQLLMIPVAKALMARFGGVSIVAYFEMAYRMVFQLRSLIAAGHQAIVPTIADVQEKDPAKLRAIYHQSFKIILFLVLAGLPFCMMITPFVSWLWIGAYNPWFILFSYLLFTGWFLNLLTNPAYFANLGTGELRWNVYGHVVIGVLNIGLGILLGQRFGGTGIVLGFVIALLIGSSLIMLAYNKKHHVSISNILDLRSLQVGGASIIALLITGFVYTRYEASLSPLLMLSINLGIYALIVAWPILRHPIPGMMKTRFSSIASSSGTPTSP